MNRVRRNFAITMFWSFPVIMAIAIVKELNQRAEDHITVAMKEGLSEKQIYELASQFLQYDPTDIEAMVMQRKRQKLKRLLEDYHALGNANMGIRYDRDKVMGGYPLDIPYDVILKLAIDRAFEKLCAEDWRLAAIIEMRYIDTEARDTDIKQVFDIADRTKRDLLSKAIDKLLRIIETGSSVNPILNTIKMIRDNTQFNLRDIRKIVIEEYNEMKLREWNKKYTKNIKKNLKKVEVIHKIA